MKFAKEFALEKKSDRLIEITRLFVKEEQRHSLMLRRFMEKHDIDLTRKSWTDSVFRRLRKDMKYEVSITVLITAEIIALSYYKCLAKCTNSLVLKQICSKIDREEKKHVEYESQILRHIRQNKNWVTRKATYFLHAFLFSGTVLVVYFDHRKVVSRGEMGLKEFWNSCWLDYFRDPR